MTKISINVSCCNNAQWFLSQHVAWLLGVLDQIGSHPKGNGVTQSWRQSGEKAHKTTRPQRAAGGSPHWALPGERLLARAAEPRHLLQHNWEICSSCIPNWSRADGRGICLMKYVHSIKLGHWGFGTSISSPCYPAFQRPGKFQEF